MKRRILSLLMSMVLLVSMVPVQASAAGHAITVYPAEGGTVTAPASSTAGETVTLTVTPASGYFVDDIWLSDATMTNMEKVENNRFTMPDYPVTIWASFAPASGLPHNVQLHWAQETEKGTVSFSKTSAVCGETITVTVTPIAGYKVSAMYVFWTNADGKEQPVTLSGNVGTFQMPDDDATVQVLFEEDSTVTEPTQPTENTDPTDPTNPTDPTDSTDPTNPTDSTDPTDPTDSTDPTDPTESTEPVTTHTVTVPGEITGGSVTADKAAAAEGDTITLTATPAEGYELDTLAVKDAEDEDVPVTEGKFTMPASDVTVTATFKAIPTTYSITLAPVTGATVTFTAKKAAAGEEITVTVTPKSGHELESITAVDAEGNDVTVTEGKFTMPASDVTVTVTMKTLEGHFDCTLTGDNWMPLTQTSGTLAPGNYYLTSNLQLTGALNITSGTVNLCLNGKTLDANRGTTALSVSGGATLNLADCGDGGTITGVSGGSTNAGAITVSNAMVNMYGGVITDNHAEDYGNIYLSGARFNMYGGSVTGNTTTDDYEYTSGGFYVRDGSALTVYGGQITNNTSSGRGGAIYCTSDSTVTINGGTISGNTAADEGKGIFYSCRTGTSAVLNIGGRPNIVDEIYLDTSASTQKYPYITSAVMNLLTLTLTDPYEGRIVAQGTERYTLTEADLDRITLNAGSTPYYPVLDAENNRIIMSTSDPGYTASHYVKYNANGGLGTTEDNTAYTVGSEATVLANSFTRTGWTFAGWNTKADGTGVSYAPDSKITVSGDIDLYAIWTKADYLVTATSTGNGTVTATPVGGNMGDEITLTTTPAAGYALDTLTAVDAYGESVAIENGKFTMPAADVTVTATFKAKAPAQTGLVLEFNHGYDVSRNPAFPSSGGTVKVTVAGQPLGPNGTSGRLDCEGQWKLTQLGLYNDNDYNEKTTNSVMHKAAEAYGVEPETLYVYELTNGTTHVCYGVLVMYNPTDHTAIFVGGIHNDSGAGYLFSNVSQSGSNDFDSTFDPTDDIDTTDYTITVSAGQGGTASVSATTAKMGTQITVAATPAEGYELDAITVKDAEDKDVPVNDDGAFTMPASNVTVNVTFKATTYTVTLAALENGTASVSKTEAVAGEKITVTATPAEGYELDAITVKDAEDKDVPVNDDGTFTMPASNVTVTVTFKAVEDSLVLEFNYGYDVSRNPAFPSSGGTVKVTVAGQPLGPNGTSGRLDYAGEWKLTRLGLYNDNDYNEKNTNSVMHKAAEAYGVEPETLYVYELTNGTTHVCYGVLVMYNPTNHTAIFVGGIHNDSGAGYLFSNVSQSGSNDFDSTFDPTDEIDTKDYTVTVSAGQGGTAFVSATTAKMGTQITVTANASTGFEVDSITAKDASGADVTVVDGKFTMPASNVTVTVTFTEVERHLTHEQAGDGTGDYAVLPEAGNNTFRVVPNPGRGCSATVVVIDKDGNVIPMNPDGSYTYPDTDVHAVVTITKNNYNVAREEKTGGEISLEDDISTYHYNDLVKVTVDVEPGYELVHLYVVQDVTTRIAGSSSSTQDWDIVDTMEFRMPDYHVKLVPVFNKLSYTLTVTANKSTVTVDDEKGTTFTLDYGQEPEVSIKANSGYTIKKITLNDVDITKDLKNGKLTLGPVDQDLKLVVTTQKNASNPYTGDDFRLHAWLFVLVSSAAGAAYLTLRRRYAR